MDVDRTAGDRSKTDLVVVAADVTHRVVRSVGGQRGQLVLQYLVHARQPAQRLARCEIHIEIELRIQHTALHVTADQLRTAVGLADHPYRTSRPTGRDLLAQHTPVAFRDMLACIVTETVQLVVLQPVQRAVSHLLAYLLALQIQGRDMLVEPSGQTRLVPKLEVTPSVRKDGVRMPVRMRLQRRRVDMHMVRYIVQHHVDLMRVRAI